MKLQQHNYSGKFNTRLYSTARMIENDTAEFSVARQWIILRQSQARIILLRCIGICRMYKYVKNIFDKILITVIVVILYKNLQNLKFLPAASRPLIASGSISFCVNTDCRRLILDRKGYNITDELKKELLHLQRN